MKPPNPVGLFHFTHTEHLPAIAEHGLLSDASVGGYLTREAGEAGIKARRRVTAMPNETGGVVGDYVPFYFAPRSPMLYRIHRGGVAGYQGDQRDLIYLCTTVERLTELGLPTVVSDRNAVLAFAKFATERSEWGADGFIDWALMRATYWNNDAEHPDRKERRMAECLVPDVVPWEAVIDIGCFDEDVVQRIREGMASLTHQPRVVVRRGWYF